MSLPDRASYEHSEIYFQGKPEGTAQLVDAVVNGRLPSTKPANGAEPEPTGINFVDLLLNLSPSPIAKVLTLQPGAIPGESTSRSAGIFDGLATLFHLVLAAARDDRSLPPVRLVLIGAPFQFRQPCFDVFDLDHSFCAIQNALGGADLGRGRRARVGHDLQQHRRGCAGTMLEPHDGP